MVIDNKGKLFGKINIIDLFILLIIVAALVGLGPKFITSRTVNPIFNTAEKIVVEVYIEETPEFVASLIKKGDLVKDPARNAALGNVTDIKIDKSVFFAPNDKGEIVKTSKPGYNSIIVIAEGTGIYADGTTQVGVSFESADQFVGRTQEFRIGNTAVYGRISSFKKKG